MKRKKEDQAPEAPEATEDQAPAPELEDAYVGVDPATLGGDQSVVKTIIDHNPSTKSAVPIVDNSDDAPEAPESVIINDDVESTDSAAPADESNDLDNDPKDSGDDKPFDAEFPKPRIDRHVRYGGAPGYSKKAVLKGVSRDIRRLPRGPFQRRLKVLLQFFIDNAPEFEDEKKE